MRNPVMRNPVVMAITFAVIVSTAMCISNLLVDGEPDLLPSIVGGVASGITFAALIHWKNKQDGSSGSRDSQ